MNYNFYASKTDKVALLNYLFAETDLRVYDLASEPGQEVCEYTSADDIIDKFESRYDGIFSPTFQLWAPRFGSTAQFRRIELNPDSCGGHTFRYQTQGWGLIQLYFGREWKRELEYSHIGCFAEKNARLREAYDSLSLGKADEWDWEEINTVARKLKYLLHNKWAVDKIGSVGVLEGAAACEQEGYLLRLRG